MKTGGFALLCLLIATPETAEADDWIEVQSPNFRVVSDQRTRDARRVAFELERIRALFREAMPGAVSDPLRPVVVVAVKGGDDLVDLVPEFQDGPQPAGVFLEGPFTHHIVVRIEAGAETVYHEYFHLLTRVTMRQLPVWLIEEMAAFHSQVAITGGRVNFGRPDFGSLAYLQQRRFIPLRTLITKMTNPHLDDPDELRTFSAQSWALVHLLMLGYDDVVAGQQALDRYWALVLQGTDSVAAFEQSIGEVDEFDRELRGYIRQVSFKQFRGETNHDIDVDAFIPRELSQTEALAVRATLLIGGASPDAATPLLEQAEALDEDSATLAEAMGLFHFRQERQEEADRWFAKAIELGSSSYVPHYLRALAEEDTTARIAHLRQAIDRNPRFAPAYAELGRLYSNDRVFQEAMPMVNQAIELDGGEVYYRILSAQALLRMGQPEAARVVVRQALSAEYDPEARAQLTAFGEEIDRYIAESAEPHGSGGLTQTNRE